MHFGGCFAEDFAVAIWPVDFPAVVRVDIYASSLYFLKPLQLQEGHGAPFSALFIFGL